MAIRKNVTAQRTQEILQDLLRDGDVSVNELAQDLNVSPSTVRRSLRSLHAQGLLRRRHGGAVTVETSMYEPFRFDADFLERESYYADEKRRIGLAAGEMVNDGDVVALSAGTTTTQVARALKLRNVTIVTNAVNIAMELARSATVRVFLTGGFVSGGWFSILGPAALDTIATTEIDIAFIGVDGIDIEAGITVEHPDEADVNAAMLHQACKKVVVCDRSKLNRVTPSFICSISLIDHFITDIGADVDFCRTITTQKDNVQRV
jgi:DeoR family transcriptional regulator of aga operon